MQSTRAVIGLAKVFQLFLIPQLLYICVLQEIYSQAEYRELSLPHNPIWDTKGHCPLRGNLRRAWFPMDSHLTGGLSGVSDRGSIHSSLVPTPWRVW